MFDEFSAWEKLYGQKHGLTAMDVPHLRWAWQEMVNRTMSALAGLGSLRVESVVNE